MAPFKGPLLVQCFQNSREIGVEVKGHRQEQLTQTLIVCLLKTHFFTHRSFILKSQQNRIELVTRPDGGQFDDADDDDEMDTA